ncbi:GNAT family N-acetyltransferase [Chloroflexota bacterium]
MIRQCTLSDTEQIYFIINEAALAYENVIPSDCYHKPYMPISELKTEMRNITFFGEELNEELVGIMGIEPFRDATLIRHAYILPEQQNQGIGTRLLRHLKAMVTTPNLLVGTWADAKWAIRFYSRHGFVLLPDKDNLLKTYWRIPERQIETSVVLGQKIIR